MSLINKMLQELDKRHAPQAAQATTGPLAANVRPVKAARVGSELFWWVVAAALLLAIAWLGWVMWQLTPRPVVNELALRAPAKIAASAQVVPPPTGSAEPNAEGISTLDAAQAPLAPVAEIAPRQAGTVPRSQTGAAQSSGKLDMLKLATEITTPIPQRVARPIAPVKPAAAPVPARPAAPAAAPRPAQQPPTTVARPAAPAGAQSEARIDRRVTSTDRDRAEVEYRRGVSLVNQGRMSEGMDALRAALGMDEGFDPARQTLVSLLIEQGRKEEAATVLQRGLVLNPANSGAAMLLARILVDRHDVGGALALLQKHAPAAGSNADYHAFAGALHQRLGRHKEAIEEYQVALRLSPQSGVWWLGLGISQEASGQRKEAVEAFRRARSSSNLNPDLLAFVDQRLRQLQ